MKKLILISAFAIFSNLGTHAQSQHDSLDIKNTALDYIEGWYDGNATRMENALHPELAKRNIVTNKKGESYLMQMGALTLINYTREHYAKVPKEKQQKAVYILDIFENAASVKIIATEWIDYLHMAKWNGKWKIINVYWEYKPKEQK